MIKIFRKYNKQILSVVVVLLMVVFVGGTALTAFISPGPGAEELGRAFNEPISGADRDVVQGEARLLSRLGLPWNRPWSASALAGSGLPGLNVMDYLLLVRKARVQGLQPQTMKARAILERLGADIQKFRLDNRISADHLEQAVANFLMVQEAWMLAGQSARASSLEVLSAVQDQHEKLNATVVAIDAAKLAPEDALVSDDELRAHFEQFKDQAHGSAALEFGYRIPDRVRVEYIMINTPAVKPSTEVTLKMAEDYWSDNKAQFKPAPDTAENQDAADEAAVDAAYETFAAAKEDVLAFLRAENQLDDARIMADVLVRRLRDPWYDQPVAEDGFPEPPADVAADGYYEQTIAELNDVLQQVDCISIAQTEFFSADQAGTVEVLGQAREDVGGGATPKNFRDVSTLVQGLVEAPDPQAPNQEQFLAQCQTAPLALIDDDKNLFVYRVISVDPAHAPESMEGLSARLTEDVLHLRAKEEALIHADEIALSAGEGILKEAFEAYEGLDELQKKEAAAWFEARPFSRKGQVYYFSGQTFSIPITVTDKAGNAANNIRSDAFVNKVWELFKRESDSACEAILVDGLAKVFVVQLAGLEPVTEEQYAQFKSNIQNNLTSGRLEALKREWFSSENIRARTGFETVVSAL